MKALILINKGVNIFAFCMAILSLLLAEFTLALGWIVIWTFGLLVLEEGIKASKQ